MKWVLIGLGYLAAVVVGILVVRMWESGESRPVEDKESVPDVVSLLSIGTTSKTRAEFAKLSEEEMKAAFEMAEGEGKQKIFMAKALVHKWFWKSDNPREIVDWLSERERHPAIQEGYAMLVRLWIKFDPGTASQWVGALRDEALSDEGWLMVFKLLGSQVDTMALAYQLAEEKPGIVSEAEEIMYFFRKWYVVEPQEAVEMLTKSSFVSRVIKERLLDMFYSQAG